MTTLIKTNRRTPVGLKVLGASASHTVNISSRGSLDQAIQQISARMQGGVWVFQGHGPLQNVPGAVQTTYQSGYITAGNKNGTYSAYHYAGQNYLFVSLGRNYYLYKAVARPAGHPNTFRSTVLPDNVSTHYGSLPFGMPNVLGAVGQISAIGVTPIQYADISAAATAMNDALLAHGYKMSDMPIYAGFQQAAGLTVDGFPGTSTMNSLWQQLGTMGVSMATVQTYPWSSTGGYDGVNAPLMSEWNPGAGGGGGGGGGSSTSTTTTTTTTTNNNLFAGMPVWAKWLVGAAAVGGAYVVGTAVVKKHGGKVTSHARRLHGRLQHHARRLTHRRA